MFLASLGKLRCFDQFLRFLFKPYRVPFFFHCLFPVTLPPMAVVVAGTIQGKAGKPGKAGKAGKTGPGQTKPRLGTTGKPAKPKQGGLLLQPWPSRG